MDFIIHVCDRLDRNILVEQVAKTIQILKAGNAKSLLDLATHALLEYRLDISKNIHKVVYSAHAKAFKFIWRNHQGQHVENLKRAVRDRSCRQPVDATSTCHRADIVALHRHIHSNLCCRSRRHIGNALTCFPCFQRIFEEMAFVRDDGVKAHILKIRKLSFFLGPVIAESGLQVEQFLVFLVASLTGIQDLIRVPSRHQVS